MRLLQTAIFAIALSATLAAAHHASNLDYDENTIEGVVDDIFWASPHIHLYLSLTKPDGSGPRP